MLKFLLYWVTFHTLGRLPLSFLYALMSTTAWAAYHLVPTVRRNIHENMRHVMPDAPEAEVRRAAKQVLRNVALYYADVAHLPRMDVRARDPWEREASSSDAEARRRRRVDGRPRH